MNTWIWGPPTWRFLHTLSFSPQASAVAPQLETFLLAMGSVLPCVYCRDSHHAFVHRLQERSGQSLRQVIHAGRLSVWMYELHELVNNKLNAQVPKTKNNNESLLHALQQKRQISFPCLAKRFHVRHIAFCDADVLDMMKMFALNVETHERVPPEWEIFMTLMPLAVHVAGGSTALVAFTEAAAANKSSTPFLRVAKEEERALYDVARAHSCVDGSCK